MSNELWSILLLLWTAIVEILSIWFYSKEEKKLNDKIKELEYKLLDKEKEIEELKGEN